MYGLCCRFVACEDYFNCAEVSGIASSMIRHSGFSFQKVVNFDERMQTDSICVVHLSPYTMTLLGTDAWHQETHGRGPDDAVGQVERAQLPWQRIEGWPSAFQIGKESIPLVQ